MEFSAFSTQISVDKIRSGSYNKKAVRGVAQFGSALGSGPRGREFESRHSDQINRMVEPFMA